MERFDQADTETRIWSPDKKSFVLVQNNMWGAHGIDSGSIALGLDYGGTGGRNAPDARKNLGLKSAALRDVGTGENQIPAMDSFTSGSTTTADWYKLPGGLLIQSGINAVGYIGSPFTIGLPVAFSNANYRIVASYDNARASATYGFAMSALPSTASAFTINSSSTASVGPVYAYWIAIGKY